VRVVSRQQWTPELAEEIAHAESVLFIDCSVDSAPGSVTLIQSSRPLQSEASPPIIRAPELLTLTRELYNSLPRTALLLTIAPDRRNSVSNSAMPSLLPFPLPAA